MIFFLSISRSWSDLDFIKWLWNHINQIKNKSLHILKSICTVASPTAPWGRSLQIFEVGCRKNGHSRAHEGNLWLLNGKRRESGLTESLELNEVWRFAVCPPPTPTYRQTGFVCECWMHLYLYNSIIDEKNIHKNRVFFFFSFQTDK